MPYHAPPVSSLQAMPKAGARLLEPIMKVEVITPEDHMGDVIGDLNSRRGLINKFEDKPGGMKVGEQRGASWCMREGQPSTIGAGLRRAGRPVLVCPAQQACAPACTPRW